MTVHLVCSDLLSDRILARLARHLVGGLGWTASGEPDDSAECNVFWPYLEYRKWAPYTRTLTAAWFTHYEPGDDLRARAWGQAAQELSLRATPAVQYARMLEPYGPTAHISHPVEVDKFTPGARAIKPGPVIGVAGWVYPGGRKGEGMVARLAEERPEWAIKAAGQGWPVPSHMYTWAHMQDFYRSLTVFLVTSTIEGGPVTMLEALACGVQIVVPQGVGACDDLPNMSGIWRYPAGDYAGMGAAMAKALAADADPAELRAVVEGMTPERWCADWQRAISGIIDPQPFTRGVYAVAYGDKARECAAELVRTVHGRGYPIALVSDAPLEGVDAMILEARSDKGGRDQKTRMYELSPWTQTLYADADTLAAGDLGAFFDLLDQGYEVVFTASPDAHACARDNYRRANAAEFAATMDELPTRTLLQPSGGVLAFRRCIGAERFLSRWHREWARWGVTDQLAMLRALYAEPVRYAWLPSVYNWYVNIAEPPKLCGFLHFPTAAREWGDPSHPGRGLWEEWRQRV